MLQSNGAVLLGALRDFLSRLKLELIKQPLSRDALIEYARYVGADKLAKHGYEKSKIISDDDEAFRAGCEIAEVNVDSYKEAIQHVPGGRAVGFMPFSTNDGLEGVKWSDHYAYALGLFESSPIFETRKPDLWAAFCAIRTEGNKGWLDSFQSALRNVPRLAVSGSDAHCFRGNGTHDKRGYGDFPAGKRTWIKADPTWKGLLQVLKEPAKRSFLGERPLKLERINQHKTFYIDHIRIAERPKVPKEEKDQVRARRAAGHFEALQFDEFGRHRLIKGTAEAARAYDLSDGGIVRVRNVDPLKGILPAKPSLTSSDVSTTTAATCRSTVGHHPPT